MKQSVAVAKLIQIHDVSDSVHAELRRRAALEDKSLSAYLREEFERMTSKPRLEEVVERILSRPPVETSLDSASEIRRMRDVWDDIDVDELSAAEAIRRARDAVDGTEL